MSSMGDDDAGAFKPVAGLKLVMVVASRLMATEGGSELLCGTFDFFAGVFSLELRMLWERAHNRKGASTQLALNRSGAGHSRSSAVKAIHS